MSPPTLSRLALDSCISNIRRIFDVGDAPYPLLRPVLMKVENPQQLRAIEEASPQICGADAELWRMFIKRDIPNWQQKMVEPKNPQNWWKVYRKLRTEADKDFEEQGAALKKALNQRAEEKGFNQMTFIDKVIDPRRTRPPPASGRSGDPATLTFKSGSKTKMVTGKSILLKARREAREASLFKGPRSVLARPTHTLAGGASKISKVAKSLAIAPPALRGLSSVSGGGSTARSNLAGTGRPAGVTRGSAIVAKVIPVPSQESKASHSVPVINTSTSAPAPTLAPTLAPTSTPTPATASSGKPRVPYDPLAVARKRAAPNVFMPAKKQRRI